MQWNLGLRCSCYMYVAYLWPFSVQCHFGVMWCTCLKMRETDWNLGLGCCCRMFMGTIGNLVLKVILGSFGAFVSKSPVTQKWLVYGEMDWNLRLGGSYMHIGAFNLLVFNVIWGHLIGELVPKWPVTRNEYVEWNWVKFWCHVVHLCVKMTCNLKITVSREKQIEIWLSGVAVIYVYEIPVTV